MSIFKKSKKVTIEPILKKEVVTTKNVTCLQYNGSNHDQVLEFANQFTDEYKMVKGEDFIALYTGQQTLAKIIRKGSWVYFVDIGGSYLYINDCYENIG